MSVVNISLWRDLIFYYEDNNFSRMRRPIFWWVDTDVSFAPSALYYQGTRMITLLSHLVSRFRYTYEQQDVKKCV